MKNSKILTVIAIIFVFVLSLFTVNIELENQGLKKAIKNQQNQINSLQDEITSFSLENHLLMEENKKLTKENKDLINAFNEKLEGIRKQAQSGNIKPANSGISPRFILTNRGGFNRFLRQETLKNITKKGSYQYKQEEVFFDVDDLISWQNLGSWKISHYTTSAEECGNNLGITTSGQLATPGFTIAVDPNARQLKRIFYSKDLGFVISADTGGSIKGQNRADYLTTSKTTPIPETTNMFLVY
ncbi:MAG: 3D domain-containing protein [Candidatus Shapirobacteria bacterium]|nr:3D domain-containing protein [Candidatus Shapirobacteria bacterium]MDD3003059.1 3D domain-containing protein [Candidatus Shapirobacteria bacterium]MDD4383421.1 3D domain-containing protein [Candidatus Shapirobacteria bacterium]